MLTFSGFMVHVLSKRSGQRMNSYCKQGCAVYLFSSGFQNGKLWSYEY